MKTPLPLVSKLFRASNEDGEVSANGVLIDDRNSLSLMTWLLMTVSFTFRLAWR
jgi:hypothetical protein